MKGHYIFPKHERLKSTKEISALFDRGRSLSRPPLFVKYLLDNSTENDSGIQVAFTVSRRNFKKAVDRNRIKRLMREAYRLNVPELRQHLAVKGWQVKMVIVFTGKELPKYDHIDRQTGVILKKLLKNGNTYLDKDKVSSAN